VSRTGRYAVALALPLAGLAVLLAVRRLDVAWEHHPAHFWLVVGSGALTFALGFLLGEAAARRGDARVLLVSLAFLASSGFLALHALATPGVLLSGRNAGFQVASSVGLLLAGVFAAVSALELPAERARSVVRGRRLLHGALVAALGGWAVLSLATLPPLDEPIPDDEVRAPLVVLAVAGIVLYAFASYRYALLYRRRRAPLVLAVVAGFVLLAEAMVAIAFARNWHATWWEWHLLMLVAFAVVARSAWREWQAEGSTAEIFADIYEDWTRGHDEEVSVLFADLQGYTSYAERTPEESVRGMLDEYFAAASPAVERHGGEVVQTIGDAIMAVFRGNGHPARAAAAGLDFQRAATSVAESHPEWPRFRVGINSGRALVGLVQAPGARSYSPIGDVVNVAARLEGQARAGEVVVGETTRRALTPGARVEDLGELPLKGKEEPARAFLLRSLAADGDEGDQGLEDEEAEPEA
jgi:adenylate cyclase